MNEFVPIWHQSIVNSPIKSVSGKNKTIAFKVLVPFKGNKCRLRFSNIFGKYPYLFGSVIVSLKNKQYKISVNGKTDFEIPINNKIYTDAIDINVTKGDELEIRLFYKNSIVEGNMIEEYSNFLNGDRTNEECLTKPLKTNKLLELIKGYNIVPSLDLIEIYTESNPKLIVAFGDSITALSRWTKPLSKRIIDEFNGEYVLINSGISGNCLLYESSPLYGKKGIDRYKEDILGFKNVKVAILGLGVNDVSYFKKKTKSIISLDNYKKGITEIVNNLHKKGIKVVMQTITPRLKCSLLFGHFDKKMESLRLMLNEWIRSVGIFDYLLDSESIVKKETKYGIIYKDGLHQGDHLHPNKKGGELLASCYDLKKILGEYDG